MYVHICAHIAQCNVIQCVALLHGSAHRVASYHFNPLYFSSVHSPPSPPPPPPPLPPPPPSSSPPPLSTSPPPNPGGQKSLRHCHHHKCLHSIQMSPSLLSSQGFQTFNSEKPTLLNLFVKFFVFCQILIHFCQSAKASQADLPFIGKLWPEKRARKAEKEKRAEKLKRRKETKKLKKRKEPEKLKRRSLKPQKTEL